MRSDQVFLAGGNAVALSVGFDVSVFAALGAGRGVAGVAGWDFFPVLSIPGMFAWSSALIPGMFA